MLAWAVGKEEVLGSQPNAQRVVARPAQYTSAESTPFISSAAAMISFSIQTVRAGRDLDGHSVMDSGFEVLLPTYSRHDPRKTRNTKMRASLQGCEMTIIDVEPKVPWRELS